MRILFVTPYLPSPPHFGAQRRLDGLMRGLVAAGHEVDLLSFTPTLRAEPNLPRQLEATRSYCRRVETLEHEVLNLQGPVKRLLQLRSLVSRKSFEHKLMFLPELQRRLDAMLAREHYDVVQVEFAQMGMYRLPRQPHPSRQDKRTLFILDEHNIEYDLLKRSEAAAKTLDRKVFHAINWRKLHREEVRAWRNFDGVALTSVRDEELLQREAPGVPTVAVANAVDLEAFAPRPVPRAPATLLFLGAMNYYPNTEGVTFFLDEIFPKIVAARPDVKLEIVGMKPPESITSRQSANVLVTGFVEDPLPYLDRATMVVVPLRVGGGTRFKIVEAMAKGKAVVSTRIGAEGIEVEHEQHVLFADEPAEFARQVVRLLDDPALGERLGAAARQRAEEKHGWRAAVEVLERFYRSLLGS